MQITAQLLASKQDSTAALPLSVSKVKTFEDCKAKYRYCYIEKLPRKEWDFHIFGQCLHSVLEEFHKEETPDLPANQKMTACFKMALAEYGPKMSKDQKDEAWQILDRYLQQLDSKAGKPPSIVDVERGFYIDIYLDGKPHILLNGFIDRVQVDPDGIVHVADYKTTKNKRYLNDFFQLMTYAYVLMLEKPELEKVRASFVLLRHDFEYLTKEFSRADVMEVQEKFIEYAKQIHDEKLWRPSPKFLCKYCDYLDVCAEGKGYLTRRHLIKTSDYGKTTW
jgi:putative RecB family exonuclease